MIKSSPDSVSCCKERSKRHLRFVFELNDVVVQGNRRTESFKTSVIGKRPIIPLPSASFTCFIYRFYSLFNALCKIKETSRFCTGKFSAF